MGYKISPLLWDKVRRGLSAGRVQSVAVRIVCEREAEIQAFTQEEYWSIVANLEGSLPPSFEAKLIKVQSANIDVKNEKDAHDLVASIKSQTFVIVEIAKKERRRNPSPPFITSKLQQEAARKLGFTAKKTMTLAQMLYEGIDIGEEGPVGLITYMRTDSTRVADSALQEVRTFIAEKFGDHLLPSTPNIYKSKRAAQDAHEAVRPTSMRYTPEMVEKFLDRDQYRLYELIWKRFIASQMLPAVFDQTAFDIEASKAYLFRATGQVLKFPGFISVYMEGEDDATEKNEEDNAALPDLQQGETLKLHDLASHQHFTQPPPRYTEASLVKALEELGIGRPSTYASIMSVIQDKEYVKKIENRFHPSDLGKLVNELLVASFPDILDVGFTAQMEQELDDVEEGKRTWVNALRDFYGKFEKTLAEAKDKMRDVKRTAVETDITCEKCGNPMVIKWGRNGEFLACSSYPECKSTKEFQRNDSGKIEIRQQETTDEKCPNCASPMLIKRGRFGKFLACSKYPECKTTKSVTTGVKCPACDAGELVERRSKRGKIFYSCNQYPKCSHALWDKPIAKACPTCGHPILVQKYVKKSGQMVISCPQAECGYKEETTEAS
ncbi:MAG: type I DNA topoisomerase [Deltaproteobacteria bacterium]|nr:type I DNA topoisomerase [Deltaproteobacteria bacterium]